MRASEIIKVANPNALVVPSSKGVTAIEDIVVQNGDVFRVEYQSDHAGNRASAYLRSSTACLVMPFSNCLNTSGRINLSNQHTQSHLDLNLPLTIFRTRFFLLAHTHWHESKTLLEMRID